MQQVIDFNDAPISFSIYKASKLGPLFHRDALELFLVLKGEADVNINGTTKHLLAGEFMIIDAGLFHHVTGHSDLTVASFYIDLTYYQTLYPYLRGISFSTDSRKKAPQNDLYYNLLRNYMIRVLLNAPFGGPQNPIVMTRISDIMIPLLFTYFNNTEQYLTMPIPMLKAQDVERLCHITQYISSEFRNKNLTIQTIAEHMDISASRIAHFWKGLTNVSIPYCITLNRVNEAGRMLVETDLSIGEISIQCGFSDSKYLFKNFQKVYGMTPRQFRSHLREEQAQTECSNLDPAPLFDFLDKFCMTYYFEVSDMSYLDPQPQLILPEKSMFQIYNNMHSDLVDQTKAAHGSDCICFISLDNNKGTFITNNTGENSLSYELNWEYIGIMALWCQRNNFCIGILINHDQQSLSFDSWRPLLFELLEKLLPRLHEVKNMELIINTSRIDDHNRSLAFSDEVRARYPDLIIKSLLIL